jgi:FkbM family methyltransferase
VFGEKTFKEANPMLKEWIAGLAGPRGYAALRNMYHFMGKIRTAPTQDSLAFPHKLEFIGGKLVCLDLIDSGSTVISGGIGRDLEFELELIRRKQAVVVGIDPTKTSAEYVQLQKEKYPELRTGLVYLRKALHQDSEGLTLYYRDNDFMSSISAGHSSAKEGVSFHSESISLDDLFCKYPDASYLKMDIEGAEYGILGRLETCPVRQVSIEFHHFCVAEYKIADTIAMIEKLSEMGYYVIDYGAFHGAHRSLPQYAAKWTDLNCELLFVRPERT